MRYDHDHAVEAFDRLLEGEEEVPIMEPTNRPRYAKKTCYKCGLEDLVWRELPTGKWKLYDKVLERFHECVNTADRQFDPCPQCRTAFCQCTNVYDEEEETP